MIDAAIDRATRCANLWTVGTLVAIAVASPLGSLCATNRLYFFSLSLTFFNSSRKHDPKIRGVAGISSSRIVLKFLPLEFLPVRPLGMGRTLVLVLIHF